MRKKLVAMILSAIMIFACVPNVFAEEATESERIIYTQEFMDSVSEYIDYIGAGVLEPGEYFENTLPSGQVILYYNGLKIYCENNNLVVFGLSDYWCTVTEEVIDGYVFTNPSFYGHHLKENISGLCVYKNGEIYAIAQAVEKGIISAEKLAEIIPFTVRVSETTAPPTISTKPSTATVPETNATEPSDDYVEPLPMPTVMTEPTEKPTEGQWATLPTNTDATYLPDDVVIEEPKPTEAVTQLPTEPAETMPETTKATEETVSATEAVVEKTVPVIHWLFKAEVKNKSVKKSKVDKSDITLKNAVSVKGYNGNVIYKKIKNSSSDFLEINRKTGAVTVKKGISKGLHKIKIKVRTKDKVGVDPVKVVLKVKVK